MKKISALTLFAFLFLANIVSADDLESLIEGKATQAPAQVETQQMMTSNFIVHAVMSELKNINSEQTIFLRKLGTSEWKDALLQWNLAFAGTEYEKSINAQALNAYLYFKSGLTITGLEKLFQISEPKKIHFQFVSSWREAATENNPAWLVAKIQWKNEWAEVFGPAIAIRVQSSDLSVVNTTTDLEKLSATAALNTKERALIDWNLALAYAKADQVEPAAKLISSLMKAKNNPVPMDLMNLTAARMLYQNGYYDAAIKYYQKIPKASEDYLEAQEEIAWSYIRKGEPQNAMAVTQSLVSPALTNQVGPETWFVRSLALLKVCDYPSTLETLTGFPKEFKSRTVELEKISENADIESVNKIFQILKTKSMSRAEAVQVSKNLPRLIVRDERLRYLLKAQVQLQNEVNVAEEIYARSLQLTGLQGQFETLKNQLQQRLTMTRTAGFGRVQYLAKSEVEETKKMLNKLHIVEAEVIQQVEVAAKLMKHLGQATPVKIGSTGSKSEDALKFPLEKELWFDEIANYKVDIKKGCQAKGQSTNQEVR